MVFWREKDLSGDVTVRPDGKVTLPLINEIQAAGLTAEQLRQTLIEQMGPYNETPTGEKLARAGDYIVRQEVSLAPDVPADVEIDVWPAEQFERLFMPIAAKPFRPFNPEPSVTSVPVVPRTGPEADPHPPSEGEG